MKTIKQKNLLKKSYINNGQSNDTKSKGNDRFGIDVFDVSIFHSPPNFLNLYAKIKAIIAEKSERVRYQVGSIFVTKANLAVVQIGVNQKGAVG